MCMKILRYFMLLMPLQAFYANAQINNADSLVKVLQKSKEDTNKVKTYFELVKVLRAYDYNSARAYAQKEFALSSKINYAWGIGKSLNQLGLIERSVSNTDLSNSYFLQSATAFLENKDYGNAIIAYSNLADNYTMSKHSDSAITCIKLASIYNTFEKDSSRRMQNKLLFYGSLASVYYVVNKTDSCIIYADSAIRLAKTVGDAGALGDAYLQIAAACQYSLQHQRAINYSREAVEFFLGINALVQLKQVYQNMSMAFYSLQQYDSCLYYSSTAMDYAVRINDSAAFKAIYLNMGLASAGLKKYNDALSWYQKGIHATGESRSNANQQLHQFTAEAYNHLKDYKNAVIFFKKALSLLDSTDHKRRFECAGSLSETYSQLGDYKNAFEYSQLCRREERQYFDTLQANTLNDIYVKYETEKKEDQIKVLTAENKLKTAEAARQSQQKTVAFSSIFLVMAITGYIFYSYRKKRERQNRDQMMQERLRISRELHDELGSTLSGIAMYSHLTREQIKNAQPGDVEKSLSIIQQSAGDMVNKLSDIVWLINPGQDSLQQLLQKLEEYVNEMAAAKKIKVLSKFPEYLAHNTLSIESRRNMYLVFKEAINNAVKYSNASLLQLEAKQEDGHIEISLQDNGDGFDVETVKRGNGLNNIQQRAKDAGAQLKINSEKGRGTSIALSVKITQ